MQRRVDGRNNGLGRGTTRVAVRDRLYDGILHRERTLTICTLHLGRPSIAFLVIDDQGLFSDDTAGSSWDGRIIVDYHTVIYGYLEHRARDYIPTPAQCNRLG